ncbi:MAG: acetate--CoA ligase [Bacteroidota bacterium]|nr:acetate--CoA ligase [Bacteroidota bacterium]
MAQQPAPRLTDAYSSHGKVYPPPEGFARQAHVRSLEHYQRQYRQSVEAPDEYWDRQARARLDWFRPFTHVRDISYASDSVSIRWFDGGVTNASYNCLDRHLEEHGDRTALICVPDDPGEAPYHLTYRRLHHEVCQLGNVLKSLGVQRGDRVTIYMPMIPEAAVAMLACSRIGAIHSVVFAGFSPAALADRILDCDSTFVITADEGIRGGRRVPLKVNTDQAVAGCPDVSTVLVVRRTGAEINWVEGRDVWYHEAMEGAHADCPAEPMEAEDPLFVLYTSGSTGKPKGVLHTTGGYLVYASLTHELVFDYRAGDIFWCIADVGWITGHSYIVYGPLLNGATQVFFEGTPTYPDASRFWQEVDRHGVTQFYTAPTAIRALMSRGDEFVTRTDRSSLRLLGTVGEPINPEAWRWYHEVVGRSQCPIVDTWWQTETGGIMITPLPGATPAKPGSATLPFFGIQPEILDEHGEVLRGEAQGLLVIRESWPGQARTVYRDHDRFVQTYFTTFEGRYFTGDGCRRDADGYYWITGRVDDVLNVSGHRMGTAEIESALVAHADVAEAAVVGYPHAIKGQGIYAYVTVRSGVSTGEALCRELIRHVRREIGPIAKPDFLQFAAALPKTRSGKIMRRILRKIAENDFNRLGDTSTLADPGVVEVLISQRLNR